LVYAQYLALLDNPARNPALNNLHIGRLSQLVGIIIRHFGTLMPYG
jgi:hypothetical protein